jgi:hypothetical protein
MGAPHRTERDFFELFANAKRGFEAHRDRLLLAHGRAEHLGTHAHTDPKWTNNNNNHNNTFVLKDPRLNAAARCLCEIRDWEKDTRSPLSPSGHGKADAPHPPQHARTLN